MGKKKLSLEDLKKIAIDENGIREKTQEEINNHNPEIVAGNSIDVDFNLFSKDHISQIADNTRKARAPYNFVPLNEKIIKSHSNPMEISFDRYHNDKFTGYIDLKIETKTPIYLRDTINKKEYDEGKESKDVSDFFSPGGDNILRIPGSSQRGLIRNITEIVSFGKFYNFEEKRLYMRGFADRTLGPVYRNYGLSSFSRRSGVSYNMSCGLLKKEGLKYFIYDCGKAKQLLKPEAKVRVGKLGKVYKNFEFFEDKSNNSYIVITGDIGGKNNDWLVEFPKTGAKKIPLSSLDVADYKNDVTKDPQTDLLENLKSHSSGVPCFFTEWTDDDGNKRYTFGHTGMFRVPYKKTIGQHIPEEFKSDKYFDISEAIFGNEKSFAGRVFIEDAFCNQSGVSIGADHPQILSTPKPTTFQHYLTQTSTEREKLKHYGQDNGGILATLRAYKQYWHKDGSDWIADPKEVVKYPNQYNTKINPIGTGTTFTGRIRFENLSNVELGALLFALDLPEVCCHKIGMAKPLGLGSIKITPTLHLSDIQKRYTDISAEWSSDIKESTDEGKKMDDFKNDFATYILNALNGDQNKSTSEDLWNIDRLKELKKMLTFNHEIPLDKIKYMVLGEFRNRPVLPKPSDVN